MSLDQLMQVPGVMAAFQYSDKGDLVSHQMKEGTELTPQILDLLAHTCVANLAISALEARGWEAMTGQSGFQPIQGFSLVGLDWSAVVGRNFGVVVRNRDSDYEAAFAALAVCDAQG
jgi:roadblock/LC7 domain-containing protein